MVKGSTNGMQIIESGTVMSWKMESIKLDFPASAYSMKINFTQDSSADNKDKITFRPSEDGTYVNLDVYNVDADKSFTEPVEIAENGTSKIYLMMTFVVFKSTIQCSYTLYRK